MSDDGFLNDLGLENVEADPNYIPDGKYSAFVYESVVQFNKNGDRQWVITYKLEDSGRTQKEWKTLDPKGPNRSMQLSFLKQRVLSLGIPESRVGSFQPSDVVGTHVIVQIKHKDGYQNIGTVELASDSATFSADGDSTGIVSSRPTQTPNQAGLL